MNSVSSVAINKSVKSAKSASKIIPFYAKRTQTSSFLPQKPRFYQKTNPKQTQTKPNRKTAKMNLSPLLTKRYEKKRLFDQNENKPKTNPNFILHSLGEGGQTQFLSATGGFGILYIEN